MGQVKRIDDAVDLYETLKDALKYCRWISLIGGVWTECVPMEMLMFGTKQKVYVIYIINIHLN